VLAEHGERIPDEDLLPGTVPRRGVYRPTLRRPGLAHVQPYDDADARGRPAAQALAVDPRAAVADIVKLSGGWVVRPDLLGSDRFAAHVVVEMTDDGRAQLRFGDDVRGKRPVPGQTFLATYRLGGGTAGNVGRDVLTELIPPASGTPVTGIAVRNPLPAAGGAEPERVEQVRQFAPQAFRVQERAVTDDDYAAIAQRDSQVQRAVATRRWTGSWYTEFVTVDRRRGAAVDRDFRDALTQHLDRFRMAGSDVEVAGPVLVALDIALTVCVAAGHLRGTVTDALLDRFSARDLPGGARGFFHPDELTFAQPVYLSAIVAAAMAVTGVAWVQPTRFQRLDRPAAGELEAGVIRTGRLEVASCDSDPARPDRGRIAFDVLGGVPR
jgi:predicted phage baseplate assembly protein